MSLSASPVILAPYSWKAGPTFRDNVLDKNTFLWEDQARNRTHILAVWPDPEHTPDVNWPEEENGLVVVKEAIQAKVAEKESQDNSWAHGPLRLYDCENMILKDQQTYLKETQGVTPPYFVVSQVWGEIKTYLTLPTVPWPIPISSSGKWDATLEFCKKKGVKWLWMDIICISQSRSREAEAEKAVEIPKMRYYYRDATACLVIPEHYETFSPAYSTIMHILFSIADTGASVKEHAEPIWDALASFEMVLDDAWLWRSWTYQELLLPKKHVLLDGQEFSIDDLERCFGWYFKILRLETLQKPSGGREYSWIYRDDTGLRMSMDKGWGPLRMTWGLRTVLQRDGYIDLLPAVMANAMRSCKLPVDRLLGVYGLLKDEDRLTELQEPNTHDTAIAADALCTESPDDITLGVPPDQPGAHLFSSHQTAELERLWKRTMVKTMTEGRVWPLLLDVMIADATKGTNWIPRIINMGGL